MARQANKRSHDILFAIANLFPTVTTPFALSSGHIKGYARYSAMVLMIKGSYANSK